MRCEVLTAETVYITDFWKVMLCSLVDKCQHFRGTCCFHLKGRWNPDTVIHEVVQCNVAWRCKSHGIWHCVIGCVVPNISQQHSAFIFSIKQLLFLYCHIPEDLNAHQDCWENVRSSITHAVWQVGSIRKMKCVGVAVNMVVLCAYGKATW